MKLKVSGFPAASTSRQTPFSKKMYNTGKENKTIEEGDVHWRIRVVDHRSCQLLPAFQCKSNVCSTGNDFSDKLWKQCPGDCRNKKQSRLICFNLKVVIKSIFSKLYFRHFITWVYFIATSKKPFWFLACFIQGNAKSLVTIAFYCRIFLRLQFFRNCKKAFYDHVFSPKYFLSHLLFYCGDCCWKEMRSKWGSCYVRFTIWRREVLR